MNNSRNNTETLNGRRLWITRPEDDWFLALVAYVLSNREILELLAMESERPLPVIRF